MGVALATVSGILMLSGCASPESRIRSHPEVFASFPADVQEKVKQGQIEVGYSKEMVFMALGFPQRKYTRVTTTGQNEIWSYTDTRYSSSYQPVSNDYWYRDSDGRLHRMTDWTWVDVGRTTEYERLRVEFESDKVKAIENLR